jgi:hypothetical protein
MNRLIHSKAAIRPFLMVSLLACAISLAQEVPKRPPGIPHELLPKKPTPTPTPGGIPRGILSTDVPIATEPLLPSNLKDFDVWSPSLDPNGFPLNPQWGKHARDRTLPTPTDSCPVDDADTLDWTSSPQWPNCTSYPVTFNESFSCKRHVNFMPVTYEGVVSWVGTGEFGNWSPVGDSDYTFNVERDDQALYSTQGVVHIEFDSRETVDNWDNTDTWWKKFRHEGVDQGNDQAGDMINGRSAIIIGLLGLDTYTGPGHSGHGTTELHPVYAMFVRTDQNWRLGQSSWAFFVRNWGNEGYCGGDDMPLGRFDEPATLIKVQFPRAVKVVSRNAWRGARNADRAEVESTVNMSEQPKDRGTELRFTLLEPEKQSWIVGDITFQEPLLHEIEPENTLPQFEALRAQINKLPKSSRKELLAQLKSVVFKKEGTRLPVKTIAEPAPVGETHLKSPRKVEPKGGLVRGRPKKDSIGELNRRKELEVLRKFLAERGVQVDLPEK